MAERAKNAILFIKQDGPGFYDGESMIEFAARRLSEEISRSVLKPLFDGATLVPAPKSAPIARQLRKTQLWPTRRLCEEFVARGLGELTAELIERVQKVPKSAFVKPGEPRPGPAIHERSLAAAPNLVDDPKKILIVDDVLTRGATMLGCAAVLRRQYPSAAISGFALARTIRNCAALDTPIRPLLHRVVRISDSDCDVVPYSGDLRFSL